MTTITDADRDAAAPFLWCMDFATHQELMEVFARHREAALEEAARLAEKWIEPIMATPHENATYRSIAAAIRGLAVERP